LADFQSHLQEYRQEQVSVFAASVDPQEKTESLVQRLGLEFPVAGELPLEPTLERIGGLFEPEKRFLQPVGIILRPQGVVEVSCYSSGPVGRIGAANALQLIQHYKKNRD
jgi:peroxiredoxin